jgi:hypothetical protein
MASMRKLIEETRKIGGHKTQKEALVAALVEYVDRRGRLKILSGGAGWHPARACHRLFFLALDFIVIARIDAFI